MSAKGIVVDASTDLFEELRPTARRVGLAEIIESAAPRPWTRTLIEALKAEGVEGATLLYIGGGSGVIPHEPRLLRGTSAPTSRRVPDATPRDYRARISDGFSSARREQDARSIGWQVDEAEPRRAIGVAGEHEADETTGVVDWVDRSDRRPAAVVAAVDASAADPRSLWDLTATVAEWRRLHPHTTSGVRTHGWPSSVWTVGQTASARRL